MLAFSPVEWARSCLLWGLIASLLMNIPMYVQPQGYRPACVAAAGLTGRDPGEVRQALAVAVHHVTGTAAALLYGAIVFVLAVLLPTTLSLNGVPTVPHLAGAVGVTLFIYYFFERVAMPRAGGSLQAEAEPIIGQWALSAFVYGTTLALLSPTFQPLRVS